jgi:hypothetical protein
MRELDEALMDRTTASQNRRHKIIHINSQSLKDSRQKSESNNSVIQDDVPSGSRQDLTESKDSFASSAPKQKELELFSSKSSKNKRLVKQSQKTQLRQQKQLQKEHLNTELEQILQLGDQNLRPSDEDSKEEEP